MRIRKQSEVEANNKFYYQLLYEALPPENVSLHTKCAILIVYSTWDTYTVKHIILPYRTHRQKIQVW